MTQPLFDLVLQGDVVLSDRVLADGYIAVQGEKIGAVGDGTPPPAKKLERHPNCLLFPGLFDAQVHAGSFEGVQGLRDATRAAAAGGVTTIVDMPFDEPNPVNSVVTLRRKVEAISQQAVVDV